jgi:hypothetical protein
MFSHDAEVGVKCMLNRQPGISFSVHILPSSTAHLASR